MGGCAGLGQGPVLPPPPPPGLRCSSSSSWYPPTPFIQATPDVGSVNFRTVDFWGAVFKWYYMMFIFCINAADWGMMALLAYFFYFSQHSFIFWFSE